VKIEARSIVVQYEAGEPSATTALDGVDFTISEGECVVVIGPTGSGKTTLLESLAGLARPTSGEIVLLPNGSGASLRERVGLVYQFPELQFFEETVFDDVAFGPRHQGLSESERRDRVIDALERVGLPPERFADRVPFSLSAGEKRRAAIACILALRRPFLMLDEPTAGLDPRARGRIADLVEAEVEGGGGVIVVTHDLELADRLAHRVVVLADGGIVARGSAREVFRQAELVSHLGLELPPRFALLERLADVAPHLVEAVAGVLLDGTPAAGRGADLSL